VKVEILVHGKDGKPEALEVPRVARVFFHFGEKFFVHRRYKKNKNGEFIFSKSFWGVSHFQTGLAVTQPIECNRTIQQAVDNAVRGLEEKGERLIETSLKEGKERFGILNKNSSCFL